MSKQSRQLVIILGLGFLLTVLACGGLLAIGVYGEREVDVPSTQEQLLIGPADLAPYTYTYADLDVDTSKTEIKKVEHVLGFTELTLTFEHESEDEFIFIFTRLYKDTNKADLMNDFTMEWGLNDLFLQDGVELVKTGDYACCDDSRFGYYTYQGNRIGALFVARQGDFVYSVDMYGLQIVDIEGLSELLDEKISEISKLQHF